KSKLAKGRSSLMAYNEQTASRLRTDLIKLCDANSIQEKKMFGALGFMVNGRLVVCVGSEDVMYKLGAEQCRELINQGLAEPVTMGKRTMKDWVNVYFDKLADPTTFNQYLHQSVEFTLSISGDLKHK